MSMRGLPRGRTRPGRLDALDAWLLLRHKELVGAAGRPLFVDVGLGERPDTTLALAAKLRQVNRAWRTVGLDSAPHRVAVARGHVGPDICFLLVAPDGWPQLDAAPLLVRAMNVLRGGSREEALAATERWGSQLAEGGLLVEGSTDEEGHLTCCQLVRRREGRCTREGLLFHTDFTRGFAPLQLRDWLPRELRRSAGRGTPVFELLAEWTLRWQEARAHGGREPRRAFAASVEALAARGDVLADPWMREHGYLLWTGV